MIAHGRGAFPWTEVSARENKAITGCVCNILMLSLGPSHPCDVEKVLTTCTAETGTWVPKTSRGDKLLKADEEPPTKPPTGLTLPNTR